MLKSLFAGVGALLLAVAPAAACTNISSATVPMTACVSEEWQQAEATGAQEFSYNTADGNFGLMVITEKEVFTASTFRDAIVQNAITGNGGDASLVKVVGERVETIDGKAWNVVEYEVQYQGSPLTFQNFYYTQPGFGSVQILGYSLTSMATSAAWKAGMFAGTIKMGS
ncbi:MAG: hypothetical protein ABIO40_07725 [Devosia sp.]